MTEQRNKARVSLASELYLNMHFIDPRLHSMNALESFRGKAAAAALGPHYPHTHTHLEERVQSSL